MTSEEKICSLHERMNAYSRKRESRTTTLFGAASAALALCLIFLVFAGSEILLGEAGGMYSGATMLFENAGGYVLLAICSFMVGVVVTVLCLKLRNKKKSCDEQ